MFPVIKKIQIYMLKWLPYTWNNQFCGFRKMLDLKEKEFFPDVEEKDNY